MLEQRVRNTDQLADLIEEVNISMYMDGNQCVVGQGDDFSWDGTDDIGEEHAYKFKPNRLGIERGVLGSAARIPGSRAIQAAYYDGLYVPSGYKGVSVAVPVAERRSDRSRNSSLLLPSRMRYYNLSELTVNDTADADFCLNAVTRAVYEVANGQGNEESRQKFDTMLKASRETRKVRQANEATDEQIWEEMYRISPELRHMVTGYITAEKFAVIFPEFCRLRDDAYLQAMANLGVVNDPRLVLMQTVELLNE